MKHAAATCKGITRYIVFIFPSSLDFLSHTFVFSGYGSSTTATSTTFFKRSSLPFHPNTTFTCTVEWCSRGLLVRRSQQESWGWQGRCSFSPQHVSRLVLGLVQNFNTRWRGRCQASGVSDEVVVLLLWFTSFFIYFYYFLFFYLMVFYYCLWLSGSCKLKLTFFLR